jgi:hypothetical protein
MHEDAHKGPCCSKIGSLGFVQFEPSKMPLALPYGNSRKDQEHRSWLNDEAELSIYFIVTAEDTSHKLMFLSKVVALLNINSKFVTDDTFHKLMSALNANAP